MTPSDAYSTTIMMKQLLVEVDKLRAQRGIELRPASEGIHFNPEMFSQEARDIDWRFHVASANFAEAMNTEVGRATPRQGILSCTIKRPLVKFLPPGHTDVGGDLQFWVKFDFSDQESLNSGLLKTVDEIETLVNLATGQ